MVTTYSLKLDSLLLTACSHQERCTRVWPLVFSESVLWSMQQVVLALAFLLWSGLVGQPHCTVV